MTTRLPSARDDPPDGVPGRSRAGRRQACARLASLAAALALGGCSSLVSRPAPVKQTYLLDPAAPRPVGGTPKPLVLRIGTVNVAAPFRAKQFVFRESDLGYASDYYSEWFVPPGTMLADALAKGLAAAQVFERVVPAGTAGNEGAYLLDGFVSAFYGDARSTPPAAELGMTFYLTSMDQPGGAPAWTHEYAQRVAMTGSGAAALAKAQNAALSALIAALARDLAAADLRRPGAG